MREICAQPLTPDAFAPYGDVVAIVSRTVLPWNGRPQARAVLEVVEAPEPTEPGRHEVRLMERHLHSTQAFFPLDGLPYLIAVAPDAPDGGPDLAALTAFVVPGDTGLQYRTALWHVPITVLGASGRLAMHVHKDGSDADCEFRDVPPVGIRLDAVPASPFTASPSDLS
ncbi:ureidoglycolate lyase [Ancylobacter sp.]|uniref:ureidoglycolate lyase n=1 Tax=Ancylobacter sp. TaxID=1872567 RepID=UPI003D0BEF71